MTTYYARKEYIYNDGDTVFSIPFSYIKSEHIIVLINGEVTKNYTYLNATQIKVTETLNKRDKITIARTTPIDSRMVIFSNTAILDKDVQNLAQTQTFNAVQEIYDNNEVFKIETNDNLAANKQELKNIIENNKQEIFGIQSSFENEVNTKIEEVSSAAEKINKLEESVNIAVNAANTASEKANSATNEATKATEQANLATSKANEATEIIENSLANIESKTQEEINKIQQTGFYMQDDKLYYINSEGETKQFTQRASLPLFSCMWSDHILNDMQYLRADTFSWQDGNTYSLAYNKLVQEYATGEEVTEDGITFKRSANGFKIVDEAQEQAILELYNSTGVAWYYILDTTNTRFKLPRTKYGFVGLRDNVGDYVAESLPSFTWAGSTAGRPAEQVTSPVNVQQTYTNFQKHIYNNEEITDYNYTNKTTGTYQDNAPVQQRATQMYLYFYVGEYTQSAVEQTAGLNAELFNNKLDLNASNLNAQGRSYVSGLSMPSSKYDDLTLLASGTTYTAPANGHVYVCGVFNRGYILVCVNSTDNTNVNTSRATAEYSNGTNNQNSGNIGEGYTTYVTKGDAFTIWYQGITTFEAHKFFYAKGEVV